MDDFLEETVDRHDQKNLYEVLYFVIYAFVILFALIGSVFFAMVTANIIYIVPFVFFCGLAVWGFFAKDKLRVEYDYTITNGLVEVGKVINRRRRKDLLMFKMKDVEILGPVDAQGSTYARYEHMRDVKRVRAMINPKTKKYFVFVNEGGQRTLLKFEPSDEFVAIMKKYNNRAVYL